MSRTGIDEWHRPRLRRRGHGCQRCSQKARVSNRGGTCRFACGRGLRRTMPPSLYEIAKSQSSVVGLNPCRVRAEMNRRRYGLPSRNARSFSSGSTSRMETNELQYVMAASFRCGSIRTCSATVHAPACCWSLSGPESDSGDAYGSGTGPSLTPSTARTVTMTLLRGSESMMKSPCSLNSTPLGVKSSSCVQRHRNGGPFDMQTFQSASFRVLQDAKSEDDGLNAR